MTRNSLYHQMEGMHRGDASAKAGDRAGGKFCGVKGCGKKLGHRGKCGGQKGKK
jgi:hypothetical protein